MFKNRKPKIITSYDESDEENQALNIRSNKSSNDGEKSGPTLKFKKPTRIGLKSRQRSGTSSTTSSGKPEDDIEDDIESVVIKPLNSRKKIGFTASKISSSSNFKPKFTGNIKIPNQDSEDEGDIDTKDEAPPKTLRSSYTKDYLNELKLTTPNRPRQIVESTGFQLHDEDIDMEESYDDSEFQTTERSKTSNKKVRFADTPTEETDIKTPPKISITSSLLSGLSSLSSQQSELQAKHRLLSSNYSEYDDDIDVSADYIPLDPTSVSEEKSLMESRIYNEYDMEEGVEILDEDLALDEKSKESQRRWKRLMMEEAIESVEAEAIPKDTSGNDDPEKHYLDDVNNEDKEETDMWERNQLMNSVVYGHSELEQQKAFKSLQSGKNSVNRTKTKPSEPKNTPSKEDTAEKETVIPSIPDLDTVLNRVQLMLTKLKTKKNGLEEKVTVLNAELEDIEKKQELGQQKLDDAAKKYEDLRSGKSFDIDEIRTDQDGDIIVSDAN